MWSGWGPLGERIFETWVEYNERWFDGVLSPIAIVTTPTQPYGKCLAYTMGTPHHRLARLIQEGLYFRLASVA